MLRNHKLKRLIPASIAILLLIFFHYVGWLGLVERGFRVGIKPVYSFFYSAKIGLDDKYTAFKNRGRQEEIYKKYSDLELKFKQSRTENYNLKFENSLLKAKVNFIENNKYRLVSTRVIGKNSDATDQSLIIDIGSKNGIKENQPVVIMDGIIIGIVKKANPDTSLVRLLNDNNLKIAATIINNKNSLGVVEGGYGLSIRMKLIPRNEVVMVGDQVITSGLEKDIPRGLLIGEVEITENEPYQPFQTAVIKPAADLSQISLVSVLTSVK